MGSMIITSQVPVDRWHDLISEKTMADAVMIVLFIRRIVSN